MLMTGRQRSLSTVPFKHTGGPPRQSHVCLQSVGLRVTDAADRLKAIKVRILTVDGTFVPVWANVLDRCVLPVLLVDVQRSERRR